MNKCNTNDRITLLISRGPGASGWRNGNENSKFWDVLQHQCEIYGRSETVNYIEETTYDLMELIEDSWLENPIKPTDPKTSLRKEDSWNADFTLTWPGMCFTLNVEESQGNNLIHLFLNINLTFIVFVHDPDYFLYTYNPQAIPMTTWIVPKTKTFHSLSLVETVHEELNVPDDPCEEDTKYNFSACVKRSLSREIGCRTKWDKWTAKNWSLCNHLDQFR